METLTDAGLSLLLQAPLLLIAFLVYKFMDNKVKIKDDDIKWARADYLEALEAHSIAVLEQSAMQWQAINKLAANHHAQTDRQLTAIERITDKYELIVRNNINIKAVAQSPAATVVLASK